MRNVSLVNNKSVKGVKNLHFQKHATLDILIFRSRTFLVFVFIDFLCKFVIYSELPNSLIRVWLHITVEKMRFS